MTRVLLDKAIKANYKLSLLDFSILRRFVVFASIRYHTGQTSKLYRYVRPFMYDKKLVISLNR